MKAQANYNHRHTPSGTLISGTTEPITIGDIRDAISHLPDDSEVTWGTCCCGQPLHFYRFKSRGEKVIGIELSCEK